MSAIGICLKKDSFSRNKKECPFVLEKKGKEFVEDCQVRRQQLEKSFLLTWQLSQLSKIENRLASFKNWPTELEMKPEELAEAGFFHDPDDDDADQVICKDFQQS